MTALASNGWSAVAAIGSGPIQVGYTVTKASDGKGMVVATDAALTASASGIVDGVATTPANARQAFIIFRSGILEPSQVPFVGIGNNTDYAARASDGRIIRQAAFGANVLGFCGKDGSVLLLVGAGGIVGSGGGGGAGFLLATVDVSISAGNALSTANHASDATRLTLANAAALKRGFLIAGIALIAAAPLGIVIYAIPGATIPASVLGFTATLTTSWAVVNASGAVVRKKNPEASDVVIGEVNEQGNMLFWEQVRPNSEIVATHAPYFADITGATDSSDALRQMILDCPVTGIGLNFSNRRAHLPKGMYLLNKPLNIQQSGLVLSGEGEFSTNIRVQNYVGPAIYISSQLGAYPMQPNVMGGRQALNLVHASLPVDDHILILNEDGAGAWVHGKSAFSLEMKVAIQPTSITGISFFITSYGKRLLDDTAYGYEEGFGIGFSGVGNGTPAQRNCLLLTLTTTAGIKSVYSPAGSILPDGTLHDVELNWSSGTMRIFIDGILQSLTGAGGGADAGGLAGTLVQKSHEAVMMGIVPQHFTQNQDYVCVDAYVASLRISDIARHTANYTPNITTRYASDANTMLALLAQNANDAADSDGVFVRGLSRPTTGSTATMSAYFPHRRDNVATLPSTFFAVIEDMSVSNVYGTCIQTNSAPQTTVRRCSLTGQNSLFYDANTYLGSVEDVAMLGTNLARVGFRGAGSVNSVNMTNVTIRDFDYGMVIAGGADMGLASKCFISACKEIYMFLLSLTSLNAAGCDFFFTDENSGGAVPDAFLTVASCTQMTMGNVIIDQELSSAAPLITLQATGTFGPTRLVLPQPFLRAHASSTGLIRCVPGGGGFIGSVDIHNALEYQAAVPRLKGTIPDTAIIRFHPDTEEGTLTYAMADANYTVTREQHLKALLEFTGALTAPRTITMPAIKVGRRVVTNSTTGGQNLLFKLSGGAVSHTVTPGTTATLWVNNAGTELVRST